MADRRYVMGIGTIMNPTLTGTSIVGWVMTILNLVMAVWILRRPLRFGTCRYGEWATFFFNVSLSPLVLALARDLHGARIIAAAIGIPLAFAAVLGLLARRKYRSWSRGAATAARRG